MSYSPLSISRRHVLGDLYTKCHPLEASVPVYLAGDENILLGHVDQSLGVYADAFTFHITEEFCKRLSAGQFSFSFEFEPAEKAEREASNRVSLLSVTLTARENYQKPIPKRRAPLE